MTPDPHSTARLAADLIKDAVEVLRKSPPRMNGSKAEWKAKWKHWARERARDLQFFRDPSLSAHWCEAAGVNYDAVLERLEAEEVMYDAQEPTDLRTAQRRKREHSTHREDKGRVRCKACGLPCRGTRALSIHRAACIGPERTRKMLAAYTDGTRTRTIQREVRVSHDMFYRLLDAHNVARREER